MIDSVAPVAAEVALLSRPEIGELSEGRVPGRGGSSTMPHKHNPVLSVLVRAAALQAPFLGAQLHLAAAQAVDQRSGRRLARRVAVPGAGCSVSRSRPRRRCASSSTGSRSTRT